MKKIAFYTLGCKLNYSETSSISRLFKKNDYKEVDFHDKPDYYVINTCSVTENANNKCKKIIREAKKISPKSFISIIGCYAQLKPDEIARINGVDLVLGTNEKFKIVEYLKKKNNELDKIYHSNILESKNFNSSYSIGDRTRIFLKIQDGCNYGCSFCTIPLARGKSRSDSIKKILEKIHKLSKENVKEIVLTGINIGDFGIENGKRKKKFIDLLKEIEDLDGVQRYRISSIEPNLVSNEIIEFVAKSNKFLPHFHIPLQSGCNKILKSMSRRYDVDLYTKKIEKIKSLIPDASIGVDVIVGYPSESESDFFETYNYLNNLKISYLHVFPYSERENTRAVKINDKIDYQLRVKRSQMLRILSKKKSRKFSYDNLNTIRNVLFEKDIKGDFIYGYTENYIRVKTKYDNKLINEIIPCSLNSIDTDNVVKVEKLIYNPKTIKV